MTIDVSSQGGIATVVISQPAKHNAVSPPMWDMLADTFIKLSSDADTRCIVLRGAGKTFCSGTDLGAVDAAGDVAAGLVRLKRAARMMLAIHNCDKPVIAAVQGAAVGLGWSLVLACDLSIASANARFIAGYMKVGLVPDGGAIWFLSRLLGMRTAKDIVYRARTIEAAEALGLGLVNQVVPDESFEHAVETLARDLATRPTHAIGLTKRLFRNSAGPSFGAFLEDEEMAQVLAKQSADFGEGVAAFLEKRAPQFTGR